MIRRCYFMRVKKYGEGDSYSFTNMRVCYTSWFPTDPMKVYHESFQKLQEEMIDKPGDTYECTAFNRI